MDEPELSICNITHLVMDKIHLGGAILKNPFMLVLIRVFNTDLEIKFILPVDYCCKI